MPEANTRNESTALTQGKSPFDNRAHRWTDEEKAKLREIAPRRCKRAELRILFPDRTICSIWKQIGIIRDAAGKPKVQAHKVYSSSLDHDDPGMGTSENRAWRRAAVRSNAAFLRAVQRAAFNDAMRRTA